MASSDYLRQNINQHTIKNLKSKSMDKDIYVAVSKVVEILEQEYPMLVFTHEKSMKLKDIVAVLSKQFPEYATLFSSTLESSFIKPDGGFIFARNKQGERRLVLVSEVKRQGTNDSRKEEGKSEQAMGNAIERLGKNLIGIRALFKSEGVLPFVCFGHGNDFKERSSILDRVVTMNEFFPINRIYVEKDFLPFEPVSMLFRYQNWTIDEMVEVLHQVAKRAIKYRFV